MAVNNTLTVAKALSGTSSIMATVGADPVRVRILSDRQVFVDISNAGAVDSSTGYPLPEMTEVYFEVPAFAKISAMAAAGEPSGTIWITPDRSPSQVFVPEAEEN